MNETLKFPDSQFSQAEFAALNGKTPLQVYPEFKALRDEGKIVPTGKRSAGGRGKPTVLYSVYSGANPIVTPKAEVAPIIEEKSEIKQVFETVPITEIKQEKVEVRSLKEETEFTCPFCQTPLVSEELNGGSVKLMCPENDFAICHSLENPYGVANNKKDAYEVLVDKFWKHRGG
jgi:transcription elongation factor Elf1